MKKQLARSIVVIIANGWFRLLGPGRDDVYSADTGEAHGYLAGFAATSHGQTPAMGFSRCISSAGYRGREPWRDGWYRGVKSGLAFWRVVMEQNERQRRLLEEERRLLDKAVKFDEEPAAGDTDQKRIQGQWKLVDADDSEGLSKKEGFAKHSLYLALHLKARMEGMATPVYGMAEVWHRA